MNIRQIFENNNIEFDSVLDSILDGIVVANAKKEFVFWNRAARIILANGPDAVDPSQWAQRYHLYHVSGSRLLEFDELPMIRALKGEEFFDYQVMAKTEKNPEGIIVSVNGKAFWNNGEVVAGITTFREINDQVKLEKKITYERNFFEQILDLIPGIVFMKDLEGKYIYGNKNFHELLGSKSVVGKSTTSYLPKDDANTLVGNDQKVLSSGVAQEFEEVIHVSPGKPSTFRTIRFPYYLSTGELKGICAVARDITQEVENQYRLEDEKEKTAHISKLATIGIFAAEITHEIKNPLAILKITNEVIRSCLEDEVIDREFVLKKMKVLEETVDRMDRLSSSLGLMSKDSNNEQAVTVTMRVLLDEVKALCGYKAKKLGVDISVKESKVLDQPILTKPLQMSEVLLNLLANSLDAVEKLEHPKIAISCEHVDEKFHIRVFDNGCRIPDAIKDKIFEPFFTTKEGNKGTGLGLSIAKKIVRQLGGELRYADETSGKSFVVSLLWEKLKP